MNKPHKIILFAITFTLIVVIFLIVNYNFILKQEELQKQNELVEIKEKQQQLTKEFETEKQQKEYEIQKDYEERMQKDTDGDGLTYEQELVLGTSDDNKDSDADGIQDNIDRNPAGGGETHTITVHWIHNGLQYTTQFGIHEDKYWYYRDQPRGYCCDGWDKFATPFDPVIQTIAQDVADVSLVIENTNRAQIAIDFVASMTYQYDIEYNQNQEYPKYAIETIIDERGDCEDTSFLMASILEALGYDVVILIYSDHVAVGVWCDACTGTYYTYKGRNYFFLETTGYADNWQVGKIWGKYEYESPGVIEV